MKVPQPHPTNKLIKICWLPNFSGPLKRDSHSQESETNLTNFSTSPPSPPLSKRAVKSSHPSRLAEVCLAVGREGGRPGGRAGGEQESLSTENYGCANK